MVVVRVLREMVRAPVDCAAPALPLKKNCSTLRSSGDRCAWDRSCPRRRSTSADRKDCPGICRAWAEVWLAKGSARAATDRRYHIPSGACESMRPIEDRRRTRCFAMAFEWNLEDMQRYLSLRCVLTDRRASLDVETHKSAIKHCERDSSPSCADWFDPCVQSTVKWFSSRKKGALRMSSI